MFSFLPDKIARVLAVPIAAQMASIPITLYHFNTLSLLAPLMNLFVVPIVSILVPLLFISLFLAFIWITIAQPFIFLAGGIAYILAAFIDYFTYLFTDGHIYLARPPLIFIAFYYLVLIGLREKKKVKFLGIIALVIFLFLGMIPRSMYLEVAFLDVGQGDGAVLKTPRNQFVVIDGGPGTTTISQYLRYQGANKVALVILSHPDADHINGLYQVFKDFKVETLLIPPDVSGSQELEELKLMAQKRRTKIIEGGDGLVLKLRPEVTFQVLHPDVKDVKFLDTNNASLIVNCSYGQQDFLFTGDVDKEIIEQVLPLDRKIEVIKIPHHGSRGSYTAKIYKEIKPQVAVISAGRANRYGHPHVEVLGGLEEEKIKIYRTDQQGAVIFSTDGKKLKVRTMLP
jgi:competence protein ComEC